MFSTTNDNNDLSNKVDEIHRQAQGFFMIVLKKYTEENRKFKDEMKMEHDAMDTEINLLTEENSQLRKDLDKLKKYLL